MYVRAVREDGALELGARVSGELTVSGLYVGSTPCDYKWLQEKCSPGEQVCAEAVLRLTAACHDG